MSGSLYYKDQDELALACNMTPKTLRRFAAMDGFPRKTKSGYPKRCVEFVKNAQKGELKGDGSLKDEKLLREIKRLDIRIKQDLGELVDRKQEEANFLKTLMSLRKVIEDWRAHETAKHPVHAEIIGHLADLLVDQIRERSE